jgi:uncharacterized membrane protein YphA (DoxX/SURF4 family)
MSQTIIGSRPFNLKTAAFWGLKIILALLFLAAAGAKLAGTPMMVHEFGLVGFGQWFRYFTALTELTGAILLLWPGRTVYGAALLTCVCAGAFFAQLLAIHQDVMHTLVLGAILAAIAWSHRQQTGFLS